MTTDERGFYHSPDHQLSKRARKIADSEPPESRVDPDTNTAQLVQELRLHKIELELKNKEMHRFQEQLEATREHFASLYYHAPVGYFTLDPEGSLHEVNLQAASVLGRERRSLIGCLLHDVLTPRSREKFQDYLREVVEDKNIKAGEFVVSLPDGERRDIELQSIALKDPTEENLVIRTILLDITPRKETERRKEFLEQQLRQAHKMEALGRLAGGIAHDFNNLLTLIIGYSKLALNGMDDGDPFHIHIAQINKAGNHAAELIDQLLAFSRNQNVVPDVVNLNSLIEDMSIMLARITGDDIEFSTELGSDLGQVHVDASQFKQVLLNLVVNAREAMPSGGRLVLRTRNTELQEGAARSFDVDPGPYVLLEVEDNGCGIDEATRAHIFEPFFTTKHTNKGNGFGLATTYGIIAQSNGSIDVVSEVDRGTTFLIYLPRVDVPVPQASLEETGADSSIGFDTILLVDDQPELSAYAEIVLQGYDYNILKAESPSEALSICESHMGSIDLVVTDVTMPGMGGRELVDRILKLHPDTRVIYMSGHAHDVVCRERGIDPEAPFLVKPFNPEVLAKLVQDVLVD
ncbi:MAG: ATP-binding protein [Bradymonadaceae bacterium]